MFTVLLLIVLYISFIALGIPDSLFGCAMPAIIEEFDIPLSLPNLVTSIVCGCTVISSTFSSKIINRFGTAKVTFFSTAVTALALVGYSFCPAIGWMMLAAVPLGLGAGAVDCGLNNYIALHFGGTHMNFLHCFYGIGVVVSPYIMSLMLQTATWRQGYRTAACVQAGITLILLLSMPLWKRKEEAIAQGEEEPPKDLSLKEMVKMASVRSAWLACFATNAVEALTGLWGATYLVYTRGLAADAAARCIIFYYLGMTLGRFLSGLFADKLGSWKLIGSGCGVLAVACVTLLLPLGNTAVSVAALFLIGVGNGPIYPNIMNLTPDNFGRSFSGAVIGSQMAVAYLAFMATPPLFGLLAQYLGVQLLPVVIGVWFAATVVGVKLLSDRVKKAQKLQ